MSEGECVGFAGGKLILRNEIANLCLTGCSTKNSTGPCKDETAKTECRPLPDNLLIYSVLRDLAMTLKSIASDKIGVSVAD